MVVIMENVYAKNLKPDNLKAYGRMIYPAVNFLLF